MTPKQKENYNKMLSALKQISGGYQTPDQINRSCLQGYGLNYTEALVMSYENIQQLAKISAKGIRKIG